MIKKFIEKVEQVFGRKTRTRKPALKISSSAELGIQPDLVSHHAVRVSQVLQEAGFKAFVVGGAVRDLLLGITPKDFDVATDATPEQTERLFRRSRIIGRRFRIVHVMMGRETIEVTTFRGASDEAAPKDEHGRVLTDNTFGDMESDAIRRDFTVNALYYDPQTQTVHDYVGGLKDVQAKTLRLIGDPETRYREDPVRMLRAVRFAAKLQCCSPATPCPHSSACAPRVCMPACCRCWTWCSMTLWASALCLPRWPTPTTACAAAAR